MIQHAPPPRAPKRMNIEEYLALDCRQNPVLLVLDRNMTDPAPAFTVPPLLDSPAIHGVVDPYLTVVCDHALLHPEVSNIFSTLEFLSEAPTGPQLLAIASPELVPLAILSTTARGGRALDASHIARQIQQCVAPTDSEAASREVLVQKEKGHLLSELFSVTFGEVDFDGISSRVSTKEELRRNLCAISHLRICYLTVKEPGVELRRIGLHRRLLLLELLTLLLRSASRAPGATRTILETNIRQIMTSDLYDLLRGGAFESVKINWRHPLPTKELFQQLSLIRLLIEYADQFDHPEYAAVIRQTWEYCTEELLDPETRLFGHDARYQWPEDRSNALTPQEIAEGLDPAEADTLDELTTLGEMRSAPGTPDSLRLRTPDFSEADFARLAAVCGRVRQNNRERLAPAAIGVQAFWENALAATALVETAASLNEAEPINQAQALIERLWCGFNEEDGQLASCFDHGEPRGRGALADYAYFTQALFAVYNHSLDLADLQRAFVVHRATLDRFWDAQNEAFSILSYIRALSGLNALRSRNFVSGVEVALENHVRWCEFQGHDAEPIIRRAYDLHRSPIVSSVIDSEYTRLLDTLSWGAGPRPLMILNHWGTAEQRRRLVNRVFRMPRYCRPSLIAISSDEESKYWQPLLGTPDIWRTSDVIWALLGSRPPVELKDEQQVEVYFDELLQILEADSVRFITDHAHPENATDRVAPSHP